MEATNFLMAEHRVIERALNALEAGVYRLDKGETVPAEFFLSAVDFMKEYADGCHHEKEEGVLFKYMEDRGILEQGCPLGVMLAEHALGRQYILALRSAAHAMEVGDQGARKRIIESARSYIALLRQHIRKEDQILFPMADHVIPEEQHTLVWNSFELVLQVENGKGAHAYYQALAEELERDIGF